MSAGGAAQVRRNIERFREETHRKAAAAAEEIAALLETYAKQNAPFHDRTGNLRSSIKGQAERVKEDLYRIVLSAGMEYGVFVELARQGRYAYLWPAITENQDRIKAIWRERLRV